MPRPLSGSPAAIRQRRSYERRRAGLVVVSCELPLAEVEDLVLAGYLSPEDDGDQQAIGRALVKRYLYLTRERNVSRDGLYTARGAVAERGSS